MLEVLKTIQSELRTLSRNSDYLKAYLLLDFSSPRGPNPNPLGRLTSRDNQSSSRSHLPDEDTLVVMALPKAAVALVRHSEDMRCDLSHVVLAVSLHGGAVVQSRDALVRVH